MKRIRIDIECANEAFRRKTTAEVARILQNLALRLNDGEVDLPYVLFDVNGNAVGQAYEPRRRASHAG